MPTRRRAEPRDDTQTALASAAVLGVAFTVAAAGFSGGRAALSVATGAVIAIANLVAMRAIIRAILREPEGEAAAGDATETATTKPATTEAATTEAPAGEPRPGEPQPAERPDHAGSGRRGGVAWSVFALLKIALLFGGVWILLTKRLVDPIPLVVGYGVLPLGIAASALVKSLSPRGRGR
jgi:hypothetical protein